VAFVWTDGATFNGSPLIDY
jgi:hypothetical protein